MNAVQACDESLVFATEKMAAWQETARVERDAGVLIVAGKSRFPSPYSNAAFPTDGARDAETVLDLCKKHFPDRRHFVWARDERATAFAPLLDSRGYLLLGTEPGMVIRERLSSSPSSLDVRPVKDEATFAEFVRVCTLSYAEVGLPPNIALSLLHRWDVAIRDADIVIARSDGEAIAAAFSITDPATGVSGIYWVGTVPAGRRQGAADAVTRAVTNAAFDRGAKIVTLQASPMGNPVYLKLGYVEVCRYSRWLSPPKA